MEHYTTQQQLWFFTKMMKEIKKTNQSRSWYMPAGTKEHLFKFLCNFPITIIRSFKAFLKVKPDVVIATGAHTTVPICYIAKLFGKVIKDLKGERLYQSIKRVPLAGGALIDESLAQIGENALQRIEYAIRDGMNTGMTPQQIIKRITGTKRLKYEDGLLNSTKIDIERIIRTLRSHISNQVYLYNFKNFNFEYVRFVSVLDGRTSKICAAVDGSIWKLNDSAKRVPPLHPNCRSILVPVSKDGRLIGNRSFVMDERKVRDIPKDERTQLMGQIDANISFKEFFNLTDNFFQKEWLGPKRYKLYKEGQFDFDKFFDPKGRLYTLDELRKLD